MPPLDHHLLVGLLSALLVGLLLLALATGTECSYSTIAISFVPSPNDTTPDSPLICAFPNPGPDSAANLSCTAFPSLRSESYPAPRSSPFNAIAGGLSFLCALSANDDTPSSLLWWEFDKKHSNHSKRLYHGSRVLELAAGDSRVCALLASDNNSASYLHCWRWPDLCIPAGLDLSHIAVGGDFVCGIESGTAARIHCFGDDNSVAGKEPSGSYLALAAGTRHACGVSLSGELKCWGDGAPQFGPQVTGVGMLALGGNSTCGMRVNGTVVCWGQASVPAVYEREQFVSVHAKGDSFCGVLMANFSLVCWGSKAFTTKHLAFERVLPGPCAPELSCKCGVLGGSGSLCASGQVVCQSCELFHLANLQSSERSGGGNNWRRFVILFSAVGAVVVVLATLGLFSLWRWRATHRPALALAATRNNIVSLPGVPAFSNIEERLTTLVGKGSANAVEQFPLEVLSAATDNFDESYRIGSGGFGSVYRGTLPDGRAVAIKRAETRRASGSASSTAPRRRDCEEAFLSELALLSHLNHKNLVRLFGFCAEGAERLLVYELMSNGTLQNQLHNQKSLPTPLASWKGRLTLALNSARGIEYMHAYAVPPIIHRDIKSANILLDSSWTAKIADFGLSRVVTEQGDSSNPEDISDSYSRAAGTVGYMDPEYYRLRRLTVKSDVYSFGVVLLELLSGCRVVQKYDESVTPRNVVDFAVPLIVADEIQQVLDARLPPPTPTELEAVAFVGYLAADCVSPAGHDRPTMTEVVSAIDRAVSACTSAGRPALSRCATGLAFE